MLTVKINDYEYDIPTEWEEVKLGQYLELMTHSNEINHIRLLSIFTGLSYEVLANLPCDEFMLKVVPEMGFMSKEFNLFHLKRKQAVTIAGQKIKTIADPSKERFGQKLYMQQLVSSAVTGKANHITLVAPTVACYYAPYLHKEKKWDEEHVKLIEESVKEMLVVEAFPEADFFLRGYMRYAPKKQMS